jgi:hypothetical protein
MISVFVSLQFVATNMAVGRFRHLNKLSPFIHNAWTRLISQEEREKEMPSLEHLVGSEGAY